MPFLEVKNFKDALLQEMKALGWETYGDAPAPDTSDTFMTEHYIRYQYYKEIRDSKLIGPVLLPTSTCQNWFSRMYTACGGDSRYAPNVEGRWRPIHELVNWSGTEKLPGELVNDGIISVNNLFKYTLNERWQDTFEYNIEVRKLEPGTGKYSNTLITDEDKFKLITSGNVYTNLLGDYPKNEFVEIMNEEVFKPYTDVYGKEHKSKIIAFRQIPEGTEGYYWEAVPNKNEDYIYKGKEPPRTKVTNRDYMMYIKFKCNIDGVTAYRYIPIFPFITLDYTSESVPRFVYDSIDMGYASNEFPPFSYQPFNFYLSNINFEDKYSLPPILWNGADQIRTAICAPSTSYNHPTYFIPENDILQFMYLTGVKFVTKDGQDGELTPYYDLTDGVDSYSKDAGVEDDPQSGTTSKPGGTVSGVGKVEENYTKPSQGAEYISPTYIYKPGMYGGIYIPTWRYVRTIVKNKEDMTDIINNFNNIVYELDRAGKQNALVEAFFHYSGFIDQGKETLEPISTTVERPTYLCAYDKNSDKAYVPINNKLFIYPYCSMELNGYGQINELRFENFSDSKPTLNIVSKFQPGATIFVYPVNYAGVKNNYDGGVAGQPLCLLPYTKNDFLNEYNATQNARSQAIQNINDIHSAQQLQTVVNGVAQGLGAVGSALQMGGLGSLTTAGKIGMGINAVVGIGGAIGNTATAMHSANVQKNAQLATYEAELKDIENRPLAVANQNAAPSLPELITNSPVPFVVWKSIRKEFAEKIDIYFSKFGYKVSKFKEIEIKTRPRYNFIKCADCHVHGSIPQDDLLTIKSIMESGITFWHDKRVGEYGDYKDNLAPIRNNTRYLNPSYMEV